MKWDYMVVGQGLAGSVLSYSLISRGKKVLVMDDPKQPKASWVAAGIYNPFTGRKLVKTWLLDNLFPYLQEFYSAMQQDFQTKFLHPGPMYRPFLSVREQNEWGSKLHDPFYNKYIGAIIEAKDSIKGILNPWGGLLLKNCGYVDTVHLIGEVTKFLQQRHCIKQHRFRVDQLQVASDHVIYQGETARKIIFCEGPGLVENLYFNWLPLHPVKGETLLIEVSEPLPYMINRGIFILPLQGKICKVGATFDHQDLSWETTQKGLEELISKLKNLLHLKYRVLDQMAGIRPATKDRRPFIGLHPLHEPLGVFNGLGTKGVSLAPYFAKEFFEFMEEGKPLNKEVTINRYF